MPAMKLTLNQVNYLNILLMLLAGVSAFVRPFETFLFAYAVLGPAHYLTEISWLHDRKYFTRGKHDWIFLVIASVLITLATFRMVPNLPNSARTTIIFVAFFGAIVFVFSNNTAARLGAIIGLTLISSLFVGNQYFEAVFGSFLQSVIHVFVFTGLFILVGALNSRNFSGLLSLGVFAAVPAGLFYLPVAFGKYVPTDYVKSSYGYLKSDGTWADGFISLNYQIMSIFRLHDFGKPGVSFDEFVAGINSFLFSNPIALAVMGFIGFAYLYHYLNWFSKTSVIQWHNISRWRLVAIMTIWLISLAVYAYDYAVGMQWLYFLSILHVLLEFPLNHLTFVNIGRAVGGIVSGRGTGASAARV
ncbi:MAG: hypothetical protein ACOYLN_12070 [Blastocatellia bacterium]